MTTTRVKHLSSEYSCCRVYICLHWTMENTVNNQLYSLERLSFTHSLTHKRLILVRTNGDMPTPIKYYNPAIAEEYKKIELAAEQKLLSMLPEEFRDDYAPLLDSHRIDKEEYKIVKQADSLCAYLKCLEELNAGNHEFTQAKKRLEHTLDERSTPEMEYFLTTFVESFNLTLDDIS